MTLFSDVVASIDDVMTGLEVKVKVTHKSFGGDGGNGAPTYPVIKKREAIVDRKVREVRTFSGTLAVSNMSVTFLSAVEVNEHDVIVLSDGTGGEVMSVSSPYDQSGRLITEAFL